MGEYEPDDSRDVTQKTSDLAIEPERTGPREAETRSPVNRSAPAKGSVRQRTEHDPEGRDPSRSSEPEARVSKKHWI